jgi:hypothetical protein
MVQARWHFPPWLVNEASVYEGVPIFEIMESVVKENVQSCTSEVRKVYDTFLYKRLLKDVVDNCIIHLRGTAREKLVPAVHRICHGLPVVRFVEAKFFELIHINEELRLIIIFGLV